MNHAHTIAFGIAGGIVAAGWLADAVQAQSDAAAVGPTPERLFNATIRERPDEDLIAQGRLVAAGGSGAGGAAMACFTCHGADGAGDPAGAVPRLSGLPAWYMYKQLNDYADGSRDSASMTGIARQLSDTEREAVSAYYAMLDSPHPRMPPAGNLRMLQWGQQIAAVGATDRAVPACLSCHGPDGAGLPPSVPYLAGQHAEYIALQLRLFRNGERHNDAMQVMSAIAKKLSDEDIDAIAAYYSRARPVDAAPRADAGQ
ncbi:MAG: c-type cytochrome [Burkholderiaceae bacterium]